MSWATNMTGYRAQGFDFKNRSSKKTADKIGEMKACFHEYTLIDAGPHIHVWIKPSDDKNEMIDFFVTFAIEAKRCRDVVNFSWDYLPDEPKTDEI